jgi:hypothetical protein
MESFQELQNKSKLQKESFTNKDDLQSQVSLLTLENMEMERKVQSLTNENSRLNTQLQVSQQQATATNDNTEAMKMQRIIELLRKERENMKAQIASLQAEMEEKGDSGTDNSPSQPPTISRRGWHSSKT